MADPSEGRPNVLIAYGLLQHPLRATIRDHLYSFGRYGTARYFHVNLGARRVPRWLRDVEFDAVVLHHTMTGQRMAPPLFTKVAERALELRDLAPTRMAFMQDECIYTDVMSELIEEFGVQHVFSVAPPSEWRKIYSGVDHDRVAFHQVLPGYLDDDTVARVDRIVEQQGERPIDIGYRAWEGLLSLGRHGLLRRELAEAVEPAAEERGLRTDISYDIGDSFHGDDWYRFLASCRYLIGAEGGSTILDGSGEFMLRTLEYLADHPGAGYEEVEAACFPGEDGKLRLFAISPRHLEACATRTCQILVEGEYSGVLRPGEHYIELKRDFSNLDAVLDEVERDDVRERITDAAYRDVVASGRWSYRTLVSLVESETGLAASPARSAESAEVLDRRQRRAERADRRSWLKVAALVKTVRFVRRVGERVLPRRTQERARLRYARGARLPSSSAHRPDPRP